MKTATEFKYQYSSKDDVISAGRSFAQAEYWQSVRNMAEEAYAENPDDEEAQDDYLWQSVDGCPWIIYTAQILEVLRHTDNDDAWQELGELSKENTLQQMAFCAMLQDCRDELLEIRDRQADADDDESKGDTDQE